MKTKMKNSELELAGLFDKDSDYDGMLGNAVQELLDVFTEQGHSGFSAQRTAYLFYTLIKDGILTPLQGTDDEWVEISGELGGNIDYQNKRKSDVFKNSKDDRAYYLDAIVWKSDKGGSFTGTVENVNSRQYVKFPFYPKEFYIDVIEDENGNYKIKDREQLLEVFNYYDEYPLSGN